MEFGMMKNYVKKSDIELNYKIEDLSERQLSRGVHYRIISDTHIVNAIENKIWDMINDPQSPYSRTSTYIGYVNEEEFESERDYWRASLYANDLLYMQAIAKALLIPVPQKADEVVIFPYEKEMLDQLTAYESIGHSPEEIKSIIEDYKDLSQQYENLVNETQPLLDAQMEGRLEILPCNVKDILWLTKAYGKLLSEPKQATVRWIKKDANGDIEFGLYIDYAKEYECKLDEFGKTVFTSRGDAQKAIERDKKITRHQTELGREAR